MAKARSGRDCVRRLLIACALIAQASALSGCFAMEWQVLQLEGDGRYESLKQAGGLSRTMVAWSDFFLEPGVPYLGEAMDAVSGNYRTWAMGWALDSLASNLRFQGRWAEAEPYSRRGLALYEAVLGPNSTSTASASEHLAWVLWPEGKLAEAEALYRRAIAMRERLLPPDDPLISGSYNNLSIVLTEQGRYTEAEAAMRHAIEIYERREPTLAIHLMNLGVVLENEGRYADAEALARRSVAIYEQGIAAGKNNLYDLNYALLMLAFDLKDQERYDEAEPLVRRVVEIREQLYGPDHPSTALARGLLTTLLWKTRHYDEAEVQGRRALASAESVLGPDHVQVGDTLDVVGVVLRDRGDYAAAEPLLERAVVVLEAKLGADHPDVALALNRLARLRVLQGRERDALALYRRASAARVARVEAAHMRRSDESHEPIEPVGDESPAEGYLDHLAIALSVARTAEPAERAALEDEAFQLAERAKARSIGAALSHMAARFAAGDDELATAVRAQQDAVESLQATEASLLKALAKPADQRNPEAEHALHARAAALRAAVAASDARLAASFPDYVELTDPKPLSLSGAQALLRDDEVLVAIAVGARESHVFAMRRERSRVVRVALTAEQLSAAVRKLRAGLDPTGLERLTDLAPFDAATAHQLYTALLEPVGDLLAGARQLIFVPDGALDSLPVGVLLTRAPAQPSIRPDDDAAFRAAPWLATQMAISVLPSASSLRALRRFAQSSHARQPFLGIGDPLLKDHPRDPARDPGRPAAPALRGWAVAAVRPNLRALFRGERADPVALRDVPSLPETADELAAMARALGAPPESLVLRERATEHVVKQSLPLSDSRVIAFATHGVVAGDIKGLAEPALILTPPAEASVEDDGLLTASEVARLKLDADWVVLSACNTAAGDGTPGAEGLSGLAKAFFYAGSRSLLVSHWPVVSDTAVTLTTTMLREAAKPGVSRAEGHRRALAALVAQPGTAHPVFWAPFVVVGEGGSPAATRIASGR